MYILQILAIIYEYFYEPFDCSSISLTSKLELPPSFVSDSFFMNNTLSLIFSLESNFFFKRVVLVSALRRPQSTLRVEMGLFCNSTKQKTV